MPFKKASGNMYSFIDYVWSPIRGRCSHSCEYCFMKIWGEQAPLHLDEKDLKTNLGEGNFIFVCHTCDMFAKDVPAGWIESVLEKLGAHENKYLLQSKNPSRMINYEMDFPNDILLGTTIETNRDIVDSKAPSVIKRANALHILSDLGYSTMVTIEPIFDFDLEELVDLVVLANPEWVNIGADSKGHGLPEPSREKVEELVQALQNETDVKLKGNLRRITK